MKNFSRNRPETTNLNHQYAIRRVDMDLSPDAGTVPGWHKAYSRGRQADVNCFTFDAVHGSVNGGRFTAPVDPTMIAACEKTVRMKRTEVWMKRRNAPWGAYRTEFYPTYDYKAVGIAAHDKAQ